ncbi:MAG TPA: TQO small subunit DoxD, partial [Jatrophihabitans sp.]|nr:TQO small subunit DoxD [Jatrophihabitans sp.]
MQTIRPARGAGPVWTQRLTQPGWLLLPLRCFLGITFTYAGLQKLANPEYLNPHSPTSVAAQMQSLQHSSPIGPLLDLSTHAPTLVGLLIAGAELAVGLGTLIGLCARIAAIGGALLSLTFFFTVSWNTTPYYYGSDIVFLFAWITILGFGSGGVLSLDAWLRNRARAGMGLPAQPADVAVSAPRLRALCTRREQCGLDHDGACHRTGGCPVFPTGERIAPRRRAELDRRTLIQTGTAAALIAGGAALLAGATAALGRAAGGANHRAVLGQSTPATASGQITSPAPATDPTSTPAAPSRTQLPGTAIGTTAQVPVGQARQFTDPASGSPAWLVHPSGSTFVAFSAICTHAGCTVQYDTSAVQFVCPCHGGVYDARTGKVLQGPPPAP